MKYIIILLFTILAGRSYGQYDTAAIAILDSMSSQMMNLKRAVSGFTLSLIFQMMNMV